jgi:hypothetical protein
VGRNGTISVGTYTYYVDYKLAGTPVAVLLNAQGRVFHILHRSAVICEKEIQGLVGHVMALQDYLKHMLAEARTLDRR